MAIKIISKGSGRITNSDPDRTIENMMDFAVQLINRSYTHRRQNRSCMDERLAILQLYQGTELLMKAYLLKKGYIINEVNQSKFKKGIKKDSLIKEYLLNDKTIGFRDAFNIVCENIALFDNTKKIIINFSNLRNEIQHRASDKPLDRSENIKNFTPELKELYIKMFPELCVSGERIPSGEKVTLYDRKIRF